VRKKSSLLGMTKQRARTLGFATVLAAASVTKSAAAQVHSPKAALVVTRGEGAQDCPDSATLAERVRTVAGASVIGAELDPAAIETWVQVAITRNFGGYSAQINTSGLRHGSRALEDLGPSCASLADAIAVTLAIFLDPYASALPAKMAQPAPTPPRPAELKAKPQQAADLPRRTRFFLNAGAGVALNLLHHALPLFVANAGLRLTPSWSLSLGGGYVLTDTVPSRGGEVELSLAFADLRGCGRAVGEAERAHLDWCLAARIGSLRGSGQSYTDSFSKRTAWLALAIGPEVVFPFTRSLSWILTGEAVLPVIRNGFDVQANGSRSLAFRPSAVGGSISLGVRGDL
jgi:hypothetical protein